VDDPVTSLGRSRYCVWVCYVAGDELRRVEGRQALSPWGEIKDPNAVADSL
jgi:hypothetical protein